MSSETGAAGGNSRNRNCCILIVDDNPDAAESLAILLRSVGHEVRTAWGGHEALQALWGFEPNVIILDLEMPDMDGCETARRIRALPGTLAPLLIALNGHSDPDSRRKTQDAGFSALFVKPAQVSDILRLLAGVQQR